MACYTLIVRVTTHEYPLADDEARLAGGDPRAPASMFDETDGGLPSGTSRWMHRWGCEAGTAGAKGQHHLLTTN
eukprot:5086849-Amphidinium_carterae.5